MRISGAAPGGHLAATPGGGNQQGNAADSNCIDPAMHVAPVIDTVAVAPLPRPRTRIRPRNRLHRCFELSSRIQMDDPTWTLVHGLLLGWIEHAWLRKGDIIYDAVDNKSYTVSDYQGQHDAQPIKEYDLKSACVLLHKTGCYQFLPSLERALAVRP